MKQEEIIDDLVKMLDADMTKGIGHINITVDEPLQEYSKTQTNSCPGDSGRPMPCSAPTLMEGLDEEADNA